jgi:predicted RNase H-like HicB family nuclease
MTDTHYIALIHKETGSGYGVSFPDVPGVIAVADTLDLALAEAATALAFAFEDWEGEQPSPRSLETLWQDDGFRHEANGAVVAAVKPSSDLSQAAE